MRRSRRKGQFRRTYSSFFRSTSATNTSCLWCEASATTGVELGAEWSIFALRRRQKKRATLSLKSRSSGIQPDCKVGASSSVFRSGLAAVLQGDRHSALPRRSGAGAVGVGHESARHPLWTPDIPVLSPDLRRHLETGFPDRGV